MTQFVRGLGCVAGALMALQVTEADENLRARVDEVIPAGFSGQVVISDQNGIVYSGNFGFADREAKLPIDENTLFDIGSVTKTFTATAVLLLAAQDRLELEMSLSHWFDFLPETTGSITLHQLLTHTSGLPQYSGPDYADCDRACFDTWLENAELDFPSGSRFQYSNPGYSTLARVIEIVSGRDYETFIVEELVAPLGAGPVSYLRHPDTATYAIGYRDDRRVGAPPDLGWLSDGPSWHLRGNGGLLASASGLHRWLQATADGATLPAKWQSRQFERHAPRRENVSYGYGWDVIDQPWGRVIDHTGGNGMFFADARWFTEHGLLLTITSNAFEREQIQALISGLQQVLNVNRGAAANRREKQQRFVRDGVLISLTVPSLAIDIAADFDYAGRHPIAIGDIAAGERFVFVDAAGSDVRRLIIVQFEGILPGVEEHYRYDLSEAPVVAGYPFRSNGYAFDLPRAITANPHKEAAATHGFLASRDLVPPDRWMMWRSLTVADREKKNELIIYYVEDLDPTGLMLDDVYIDDQDSEAWIKIQETLEKRANSAFRLGTLNEAGEPDESSWSAIPAGLVH